MLPSIIRYFRACYQADLRAVHLLNFFSSKITFARLDADAEWISGRLHSHPVPTDWGTALTKHLLLHSKEQQLYACAFMLIGRSTVLGKSREVCAPLYLIPVTLFEHKEVFLAEADFSNMVLNPAFAEVLQGNEDLSNGLYPLLQQQLPTGPIGFETLCAIQAVLQNLEIPIDFQDLMEFPVDLSAEALKRLIKTQRDGFRLLPVMGLGVMDKPAGSLGVLNELETMAVQQQFSPVIQRLFLPSKGTRKRSVQRISPLPVTLSSNQEAILQASATEILSIVNGPPGTGKSFTIAAIAADRFSKGESVLIAAKNTQAVEVIADKLERDFQLPDIAIRATRKDYRKHLRQRIKNWLYGAGMIRVSDQEFTSTQKRLAKLKKKIDQLSESIAQRSADEIRVGHLLLPDALFWRQRLHLWWLQSRIQRRRPFWELMSQLEQALQESHQTAKHYLKLLFFKRLRGVLNKRRRDLQTFWEALKAKTGNEKALHFQGVKFSRILPALPVWLVNSANVHQVLPLEAGLFDLVIIDEASQSDIASVLPLLQRAKRAVIVGDPHQLRHVSFLSFNQQEVFAQQFGLTDFKPPAHLSYRDTSILDLVVNRLDNQNQIHMLDEHFRSLPGIIAFSNQQFYGSRLKIMTATPITLAEPCLFICQTEGVRNAVGQNLAEAQAIVSAVTGLVAKEEALSHWLCQSIGVLSPFRAQVDLLKRLFADEFTAEQLQRHRILIGSPHDFQGEERDVMYLSWVVDGKSPAGVFHYLNKEDVFNVSITRARVAQHILLSVPADQMPANNLLRHYLEALVSRYAPLPQSLAEPVMDVFMAEVLHFLERKGIHLSFTNYPIAGMEIDLVLVYQGQTYCIDLIGYPGTFQSSAPIERWKMLDRIGVCSFTLPYSQWHFHRVKCEQALLQFLDS